MSAVEEHSQQTGGSQVSEGRDEAGYAGYASDSDPANFFGSPINKDVARKPTKEDEEYAVDQPTLNKAPADFQIQGEILNKIAEQILQRHEEDNDLPAGSIERIDFSEYLDIEFCHRLGPADPEDKFIEDIKELKADPLACRFLARRHMFYRVQPYLDRGRTDFLGDEGNAALYQVWFSAPEDRVGFSTVRKGKGEKRKKSAEEVAALEQEKVAKRAKTALEKLAKAEVKKREAEAKKATRQLEREAAKSEKERVQALAKVARAEERKKVAEAKRVGKHAGKPKVGGTEPAEGASSLPAGGAGEIARV